MYGIVYRLDIFTTHGFPHVSFSGMSQRKPVDHSGLTETQTIFPALSSGHLLQFAIEAMAIEIVDLPIKNGDCP